MSATADSLRQDVKVIGLVGLAHGLSHFFQIATAVLFPLIKDELGVSYAALGATVALYYIVSGICQTLAGFAVDRYGARRVLFAGLALAVGGALMAGLAQNYGCWCSRRSSAAWATACSIPAISRSSMRVCKGAARPCVQWPRHRGYRLRRRACTRSDGAAAGWRGALLGAAVGALVVVVLALQREFLHVPPADRRGGEGSGLARTCAC
jgi:predicted MFS family arabinose efflux permease